MNDISPNYRPNQRDREIIEQILPYEATPQAILEFERLSASLTDHTYWFLLSTLWVSYSGWSDLNLWKRLFRSPRRGRHESIMKPSEVAALKELPMTLIVYRAHRKNEQEWISYTLNPITAARFAVERGVHQVVEYRIKKKDVLALFLRRGEEEVISMNKKAARRVRVWDVKKESEVNGQRLYPGICQRISGVGHGRTRRYSAAAYGSRSDGAIPVPQSQ